MSTKLYQTITLIQKLSYQTIITSISTDDVDNNIDLYVSHPYLSNSVN